MEQELLEEILQIKNEVENVRIQLAAMLILMDLQQAKLAAIEVAVLALSQGK